jgi:LmbE family N-acetylglucosaminyl deacetylase
LQGARRTRWWILASVALLAFILIAAEALRRHALYWYDVRRDYQYEWNASTASLHTVRVASDHVLLPSLPGPGRTEFLELKVHASLGGWWFEPCIEIVFGDRLDQQCFERGARGLRYVLLPPGAGTDGGRMSMRGHHLRWAEQSSRIVRFETPPLLESRILVLAPHPDDAEIAAYGLYAGRDSYVATITAGNYVDRRYGHLGVDPPAQDRLRGEMRVWDSLFVPQMGGVGPDRTVNLGYETYTLAKLHDRARDGVVGVDLPASGAVGPYRQGAVQTLLGVRPATHEWSSVVADLVALVETTRPDLIVAPHPALDAHSDHQYTTIALLEALQLLDDRSATLLLYTNHHTLSEHYPYGGSTTAVTLPPWFGGTPFASVYSHAVDSDLQLRKLFALEAMHDLRAAPLRLNTGAPMGVLIERLRQAAKSVRQDPFGDYSYFRRAVRPNELFFVYPASRRPGVDEFLEAAPPDALVTQ